MNRNRIVGVAVALLLGFTIALPAQTQTPLVGAWERISLLNAEGKATQPPSPAAFLVFTADGFFSQSAIPTGRSKVNKPLEQMTKEEVLQRFNRLEARRGTYTVTGNRLTRRNIAHGDPNQEGTEQVQLFRVDGSTLILSSSDPKSKGEARFRRAK